MENYKISSDRLWCPTKSCTQIYKFPVRDQIWTRFSWALKTEKKGLTMHAYIQAYTHRVHCATQVGNTSMPRSSTPHKPMLVGYFCQYQLIRSIPDLLLRRIMSDLLSFSKATCRDESLHSNPYQMYMNNEYKSGTPWNRITDPTALLCTVTNIQK